MWFKSLTGFRLIRPIGYTAEELHDLFTPLLAKELGAYTPNTYGWTPALGQNTENLAHGVGDAILIAAKKTQKVVPASVINEKLDEKIAKIEKEEDRKVRTKEKRKLKEEILFELYPKALHQSTITHAYIDMDQQWLIINSTSPPAIKTFIQLWERSLPGVKLVQFEVKSQLVHRLAKWVREEPGGEFELGHDCNLFDPRQVRRTVTFKYQNLLSNEVHAHLETGHLVNQLSMNWAERVSFVIDNNLALRRIRFDDVISEQFEHVPHANEAQRMDADFALMSGTLRHCLLELVEELGGFVDFKDAHVVSVGESVEEAGEVEQVEIAEA